MNFTMNFPKEEQPGRIRVQQSGLAILHAVALPILCCLAACPSAVRSNLSTMSTMKQARRSSGTQPSAGAGSEADLRWESLIFGMASYTDVRFRPKYRA